MVEEEKLDELKVWRNKRAQVAAAILWELFNYTKKSLQWRFYRLWLKLSNPEDVARYIRDTMEKEE